MESTDMPGRKRKRACGVTARSPFTTGWAAMLFRASARFWLLVCHRIWDTPKD